MREGIGINDTVKIKMNGGEPSMGETVIKIKGEVEGILRGDNGEIKERFKAHNLIVNNGKYGIADQLLASPTIGKPSHMAIGTGTTTPAAGDTALVSEAGRVALTNRTRSNNVVTITASFPAGTGTGAITEAGIFNASSAGTMYSRVTFSAINKGANDSLDLTWTYTIG